METNQNTTGKTLSPSELLRNSRIGGFWYLLMAFTGPLGMLIMPGSIFIAGDAAATAVNIVGSETFFRLGFVSYLVSQLVFIPLVLAFHHFLKSVDRRQARLMVALVVASVPIALLNLVCYLASMQILSGADYLKAFEPAQLQALAFLFIEIQKQGEVIAAVFWGLWLLPLGILVYKSGWFPKIFGIFLLIGGSGYLADCLTFFLFPDFRHYLTPVTMVTGILGEIPFLLWLVIRGARAKLPAVAS